MPINNVHVVEKWFLGRKRCPSSQTVTTPRLMILWLILVVLVACHATETIHIIKRNLAL